MKLIPILLTSILLIACGATSSKDEQSKLIDENWQMTFHVFTTNTYTQAGLLDTSYKTMLTYQMGMLMDTIKSIVVRKYDDGKLIDQKEFTIDKDGLKTLSNEAIKQYDENGKEIIDINMMGGYMLAKAINKFNNKGQIIQCINLFQRMNSNPNDFILDSVIAHKGDKKHFQYDTSILHYEFDTNGNEIRATTSDTKGATQKISLTQYSGKEKTLSFDMTPKGDTIAKFIFKKDGNLIKQVAEIKELNAVDTIWSDKDKVVKLIGHHDKIKYKSEFKYNSKGDEIESTSYK